MPRKAAPAEGDADPVAPRRSTRIIVAPVAAVVAPKPKTKKAPAKRTAQEKDADAEGEEEDDAAGPSKKKTKSAAAAVEETAMVVDAPGSDVDELAEPTTETVVKTIEIGDVLPSLTLKNEKEEDIDIGTLAAEKGVVLFLIPKADTPGCTTQACGFRDIYPDFTQHGFDVYCVSADTSAAQTKWQSKKTLPYALISDRKKELIRALGALNGASTKRSHFIFEKGTGKLLDRKLPVKPADSPRLALEFVKSLTPATAE